MAMEFLKRRGRALADDHTLQRLRRDGARIAQALPRATGEYLQEKVPIVHWLPKYDPRWLLNDLLAGVTVGALLIPQALAYAKLATTPPEFGLMSAWLPNFLYFIMGTSKGKALTDLTLPIRMVVDEQRRHVIRSNLTDGSPHRRNHSRSGQ
jgi:sodium-independent sulfate anion transporter 11